MTEVACPCCDATAGIEDPESELPYCENIECAVCRLDGPGQEVSA